MPPLPGEALQAESIPSAAISKQTRLWEKSLPKGGVAGGAANEGEALNSPPCEPPSPGPGGCGHMANGAPPLRVELCVAECA